MLANIHIYILTAVTIFFLLSNLSQILDVAFLLPISIYLYRFGLEKYKTRKMYFDKKFLFFRQHLYLFHSHFMVT